MPYPLPASILADWRSRELVGTRQHTLRVRVRRGLMDHHYAPFTFLDGTTPDPWMTIAGSDHNAEPWQGFWRTTGDWITVPNVQSFHWTRDGTQATTSSSNGVGSGTLLIDNIIFKNIAGLAGAYHAIKRGYLSPWLGQAVIGRVALDAQNEWFDVLNGGYQVEVTEGYGNDVQRTFMGLIEDCDMESHPDHITVTCRDFGLLITDQRVMGWNKAADIPSPVTFADRKNALGATRTSGAAADATDSSEIGGHPASDVTVADDTDWISAGHSAADVTEWVEVTVPAGYYDEVYVRNAYSDMELYLSVQVSGTTTVNGAAVAAGWVDLGNGLVPGANGGEQWTNHWPTTSNAGVVRKLGCAVQSDQPIIIRASYRNLSLRPEIDNQYHAACRRLLGYRIPPAVGQPGPQGNTLNWILVDDVADVVRTVLMWAGFHEWDVEDFGWSIDVPMSFGMSHFFSDIIDNILIQGNFQFFMRAPTSQDLSIGVPVFRHVAAADPPPAGMLEIAHTDLLETVESKFDLSELPYLIRYRGAPNPASGVVLGEDTIRRYQGQYFPPWSGADYSPFTGGTGGSGRVAGVRRHFLEIDQNLQSDVQCIFACLLVAIQYALAAASGQIQIPGLPGLELDDQVGITDEGTGTNSRLWVASIDSNHTLGPSGSYHMTLGGSYLDWEDMALIALDYASASVEAIAEKAAGIDFNPIPPL